jgi:8-oxo-dGTP pyrophosphatase MutT (NUDIX family)
VINEKKQFVVQKRSMQKDYCPGFIDLAAGGIVTMAEQNPDEGAAREVEEELGIPYNPNNKPEYLFKFPYQDDCTVGWQYVYYMFWNGPIKA